VECLGSLVVGDQNEARRLSGAREIRQIQRAGSKGEAGDSSSPAASAQMAADTFKRNTILKVRKQLADERQHHADFKSIVQRDRFTNPRTYSVVQFAEGRSR
jgi:hypothetical protein